MELKPQTILQGGRYVIHGVLGRGGFGVTYLAEQVMAKRRVCIKEFFPKDYYTRGDDTRSLMLASQGFAVSMNRYKEKFVKEAQTIAALDHHNIIPIYDVFEENNTAYYVMEYIDGESLSDVIKRRGALSDSEAVDYICQAGSALEYLHDRRIMHLDVKPGNIMVRRKDNRVVLIDFGLSKHYDAQSGEATSTTPVGVSHGYAPLEQYKQGGVSTFSPETDVYSLGATLYALVVGRAPAEAATLITESIDFPQHVSSSLRNAIIAAMAPSPKQRPASVREFLAMLGGVDVSDKSEDTIRRDKPIETDKKPIDQKPESQTTNDEETKTKKSTDYKLYLGIFTFILVICCVVFVLFNVGVFKFDDMADYNIRSLVENSIQVDTQYSQDRSEDSYYIETVGDVKFKMIWVDGGTFQMGSSIGEEDEEPVHNVTLDGYWIAETEVTQELWESVMYSTIEDINNSYGWGLYGFGDNYPMYYVNYFEALEFVKKLSKLTGRTYSLPTEAQWEFAALGGNKSNGYVFSGGDVVDKFAWYYDNSKESVHPVKSKGPNELGLYDMSGNVWEWCLDWYGSYSDMPQINPIGSDGGSSRILRGGGWSSYDENCRVTDRGRNAPDYHRSNNGFRIVCNVTD